MFSAVQGQSPPPRGRLRVLRLSLNTPVVAIEALPVGPVAAGLAVHEGPEGRSLTLALRSIRTGQLLLLLPEDDWEALHGPELAVDAALSFAESMGFLFDDDPLAGGGDAGAAARLWTEFLAEAGLEAPETGEIRLEEPAAVPAPLLSKFRFLASVPMAGRLAAPPVFEEARPVDLWVRALSRF